MDNQSERIKTNLRFLYSQDLSNRKTDNKDADTNEQFLYSQDLSNRKTVALGEELE